MWRKLGLVFVPDGRLPWARTHASLPFARPIGDNLLEVYYSSRDESQRSYTMRLHLEIEPSPRVVRTFDNPLLSPGALGCFDDSGAMLTWLAGEGDATRAYYVGWNRGITVPFRNSIGLAVPDGDGFKRFADGPILDRTMTEPHFVGSCCVVRDGAQWRMWYLGCQSWDAGPPIRHRYHLRYAESGDGVHWRRDGRVAIDFRDASEYAISRPSVIKDAEMWRMWYSYRGDAYRIGYAESADGIVWTRLDEKAGIEPSAKGWDGVMIEYPHVFDHKGRRYMLYNGDGYGLTGFGLAVWDGLPTGVRA
jgi:hypothetical protein